MIAAKAKENQGTRTDLLQKSAECPTPVDTRQEVAKAANVSHDTVAKVKGGTCGCMVAGEWDG